VTTSQDTPGVALFRRVPATFLLRDLVFEPPARSSVRRVDSDRYRRLSDAAFGVTAFVTERTAVRHAPVRALHRWRSPIYHSIEIRSTAYNYYNRLSDGQYITRV